MKQLEYDDFKQVSAYGLYFPDLTFKESVDVLLNRVNELTQHVNDLNESNAELLRMNKLLSNYIIEEQKI